MSVECMAPETEERRKQQVDAARRKLKTFRASRAGSSRSSTSSSSPTKRSPNLATSPILPIPLTTGFSENFTFPSPAHSRKSSCSSRHKCKVVDMVEMAEDVNPDEGKLGTGHRRAGSRSSMGGHRRQKSSVSLDPTARASVLGFFDMPAPSFLPTGSRSSPGSLQHSVSPRNNWLTLPALPPSDIITTPATPLTEMTPMDVFSYCSPALVTPTPDDEATRERMNSFSFGSKLPSPSASMRLKPKSSSPFSSRRTGSISASPFHSPSPSFSAPSNLNRLSTPLSRPPSLFVINPTPTPVSPSRLDPSAVAPPVNSSPSPPTPARSKRHSHTRSNSISLPNLKLGSRPTSLGIPSSPSFPSCPTSPTHNVNRNTTDAPSSPNIGEGITGKRLKFEPSGRGAEAEKEKEESRRKALEKLTGKASPRLPPLEEPTAEISLPDLDDDETCSVASSVTRPLSDAFTSFTFGRPTSLTLPSASNSPSIGAFQWADEQPQSPVERWSFGQRSFDKEEGLGFGLDSFSMSTNKRASITTGLSVLAEVDETEEEGETSQDTEESQADAAVESPLPPTVDLPNATKLPSSAREEENPIPAIAAPTPSRLRELHLVSSASISLAGSSPRAHETPDIARSTSMSRLSTSITGVSAPTPTRTNSAGRTRPRPLSGMFRPSTSSSINGSGSMTSPAGSQPGRSGPPNAFRRRMGGSGSISYKKDISTSNASENGLAGAEAETNSRLERRSSAESGSSLNSFGFMSPPSAPGLELAGSPTTQATPAGFPGLKWSGFSQIHSGSHADGTTERNSSGLFGLGLGSSITPAQVDHSNPVLNFSPNPEPSTTQWAAEPMLSPPKYPTTSFGLPAESSPRFSYATTDDNDILDPTNSEHGFMVAQPGSWGDAEDRMELEMERDALREDVEVWRGRCEVLEGKVEKERKEVVVLRERVRKLGDRLSSISSSHPPLLISASNRPDPSSVHMVPAFLADSTVSQAQQALITELQQQLFTATSSLERDRREHAVANDRISQLEEEVFQLRLTASTPAVNHPAASHWGPHTQQGNGGSAFSYTSQPTLQKQGASSEFKPVLPSQAFSSFSQYHDAPEPIQRNPPQDSIESRQNPSRINKPIAAAEPVETDNPKTTRPDMQRMESWGFPSSTSASQPGSISSRAEPSPPNSLRGKQRESFFALPEVLRRRSDADEGVEEVGVDLPCFVMSPNTAQRHFPTKTPTPKSQSQFRSQSNRGQIQDAVSTGYIPTGSGEDMARTDSVQSATSDTSMRSDGSSQSFKSVKSTTSASLAGSAVSALSYFSSWMSGFKAETAASEAVQQTGEFLPMWNAPNCMPRHEGTGKAGHAMDGGDHDQHCPGNDIGQDDNEGDQTPRAVFDFNRPNIAFLPAATSHSGAKHDIKYPADKGDHDQQTSSPSKAQGKGWMKSVMDLDFRNGCRCCSGEVIEL